MVEGSKQPNRTCRVKREINMRNTLYWDGLFIEVAFILYAVCISLTLQPMFNFTARTITRKHDIHAGSSQQNLLFKKILWFFSSEGMTDCQTFFFYYYKVPDEVNCHCVKNVSNLFEIHPLKKKDGYNFMTFFKGWDECKYHKLRLYCLFYLVFFIRLCRIFPHYDQRRFSFGFCVT